MPGILRNRIIALCEVGIERWSSSSSRVPRPSRLCITVCVNICGRTFKTTESPITIGRQEGSTIYFPTGTLSRHQCRLVPRTRSGRIQYESPNWVLCDGDGTKPSTNGTWLFVDNYCELEDGTVFKAAQTMFRVRLLA